MINEGTDECEGTACLMHVGDSIRYILRISIGAAKLANDVNTLGGVYYRGRDGGDGKPIGRGV